MHAHNAHPKQLRMPCHSTVSFYLRRLSALKGRIKIFKDDLKKVQKQAEKRTESLQRKLLTAIKKRDALHDRVANAFHEP